MNCPENDYIKIQTIDSIPCLRKMQTKLCLQISECLHSIDYPEEDTDINNEQQVIESARYIISEIQERIDYLLTNNI